MIYSLMSKVGLAEKDLPSIIGRPLFRMWWSYYRSRTPQDLCSMMDHLVASSSFHTLSPYWLYLARKNIKQLTEKGVENFKQTVARHYFVIIDWKRDYYYANLMKGRTREQLTDEYGNIKQHEHFTVEESHSYNVFTSLLLEHMLTLPSSDRYIKLEEPDYGNPAYLFHEGRRVTSDLLNSLLDYDSIFHQVDERNIERVIEIGGGYGRNAFCNISLLPKLKQYVMVDIPPALFLAQNYLSSVFPDKKIFRFRPFTSFADVEEEFSRCDIAFLLPEQIAMLPDRSFDIAIAIDCLHEMDKKQVDAYFDQFDRLATLLYFRCSIQTREIFYQWKQYPAKTHWKKVVDRETFVPARYFESLYQLHPEDRSFESVTR